MGNITVPYTKTRGLKMAYNQISHAEFDDIDDLVDDANEQIISLKRLLGKCHELLYAPKDCSFHETGRHRANRLDLCQEIKEKIKE